MIDGIGKGSECMKMNRNELLERISAIDFYLIDLNLYLNTHPSDEEALMKYNECVMEVKALREEFNENFGMLLSNNSMSRQPWQWIDNPWPWQKSFNFEMTGDNS